MKATKSVPYQTIYAKLAERVSSTNARLLLRSAVVQSGKPFDEAAIFDAEEAKTLCLELIKKGGPAFHVGREVYQSLQ